MRTAARDPKTAQSLQIHPATPTRWKDLETLFGPRGACAGCWCMWWRLPRAQFRNRRGPGTKRALKRLVSAGAVPGLLAYVNGEPAGWCAIAPRADYPALARSRVLAPVDASPVWSVTCFFVGRKFRRQGLTVALLRAAVEFAQRKGASIVEGYPVAPAGGETADAFAFTGLETAFKKAGFAEVARRSPTRPIMRFDVNTRS
ncbi:MAG: GNAT family N-acetyltransferase [Armatimonadota bacterium]|nr:GNAT family N-acetyltransferase [Armatimonadota bacterium]